VTGRRLRIDVQVEITVTEYGGTGAPSVTIGIPHTVGHHVFGVCTDRAEADGGHIEAIAQRCAQLATEAAIIHPRRGTPEEIHQAQLDSMGRLFHST
jgi:hypothetical protein